MDKHFLTVGTTMESNTGNQEEHTFTQDEMNAIIADRLSREKSKYADYDELKKKALAFDEAEEASKTEQQNFRGWPRTYAGTKSIGYR